MGYHEHKCLICEDKEDCMGRNCSVERTCEGCNRAMRQLGDSHEYLFGILLKRVQRLEALNPKMNQSEGK